MIDRPFDNPKTWPLFYGRAEVPVLRRTAQELQRLAANAENASARSIASVIMQDPLMTLRVLQYIEKHRGRRQATDITTIERALVMIGMGPFFREFSVLPVVEDALKNHPKALVGLLKVISRTRKASAWARDWSALRHDIDSDEIAVAALLRYLAEMLMWCFAPTLALKAREMQQHDHSLRSSVVQESVYGINLDELQLDLARQWRLPDLLIQLMDPTHAEQSRVRTVKLACDLARHAANGWDDAALPDDYKAICELLRIDHESLMKRLGLNAEGKPLAAA